MIHKNKNLNNSAFTIVELLMVIVIIGILAAITIVSYTGITARANIATVQADLANASKKINMYYALYGVYPTDMINDGTNKYCPSAPTQDTNYCIKPSSGTFIYNPIGTPITDYDLRADNGSLVYHITKDSQPTNIATTPITAIAATTGTAQIGQTLTAGAVTPGGATVSYQWQAATTAGGTYGNISGATNNTYTLVSGDFNKYIKVMIYGTGAYSGAQTSAATIAVTDPDWIMVGVQKWAKANLNVGTRIVGTTNQTNNSIVEKYCYNNDEANCITYGGFYQWDEAMGYNTVEGAQGICPSGSHIPSDNEWKNLEMSLSGMTQATADTTGWRGTDEGTKIKPGGSSGLNLPLAGFRNNDGSFNVLSTIAYLWSSSELTTSAWFRNLNAGNAALSRSTTGKAYGFSVRCIGN